MSPTNPADLTASQARSMIKAKKLSPVELARACIDRVETLNPAVNALVAYDFDRVVADAEKAETEIIQNQSPGILHGLPIGVKDMVDVQGLPTTYGSPIFRNNIAANDDPMVKNLREAGAIPFGKTNNPEWSAGGNTRNTIYGVTGNPYDTLKSAAGSSGGSAVLLAARMAPLATGSDTGGSLRTPAAFCGIVGFRPSPGVVPGHNRGLAVLHLSTSGPMARDVADVALMLSAIAKADRADPLTAVVDGRTAWEGSEFAQLKSIDTKKARVAFTTDFGFAPTSKLVREKFATVAAYLSPNFGTSEFEHPKCEDADRIFSVLRGMMFLGRHVDLLKQYSGQVGPNVVANVLEGLSYSASDVAQAITKQGQYHRGWQVFFEDHDFIISPASTITPPKWTELYPMEIDGKPTKNYYHWLALAYASTIAGHPSITLPSGRDETGMPFGIQIVGRRHEDKRLLEFSAMVEEILGSDERFEKPSVDVEGVRSRPRLSSYPEFLGFGSG